LHITKNYEFSWERIHIPSSLSPCSRESASAVLYKNKRLIVFGGCTGKSRLNDVWSLNIDTFQWTHIKTKGSLPKARSMHSADIIGDRMFFFGGMIKNEDSSDSEWKVTDSFGYLNLDQMTFKSLNPITKPAARCSHATVTHKNKIYIFSGRADFEYGDNRVRIRNHADFWMYEAREQPKVIEKIDLLDDDWIDCEVSPSQKTYVDPIYDLYLEKFEQDKFYRFYWSSTLENVEYVVNLESYFQNVQASINVYRGSENFANISFKYFEDSFKVDYYALRILAHDDHGDIIFESGLKWNSCDR
jgi:hypothetical protein